MTGNARRMAEEAARTVLEDLIQRSGEGYAAISRLIGRNPAYIQQFIRRGVPRRLSEPDRRLIAEHFGVPETVLGGLPPPDPRAAAAGGLPPGAAPHAGRGAAVWIERVGRAGAPPSGLLMDASLVAALAANPSRLRVHLAEGDSMAPTFLSGDLLIADTAACDPLRDGLYLLAGDSGAIVRRIAVHPATGAITLLSDNAGYPSWKDVPVDTLHPIGRIVWFGRRIA